MLTFDDLLSYITSSCFDALKDNIKKAKAQNKLLKDLEKYVNHIFVTEFFDSNLRIDYQGFQNYVKNDAIDDIQDYMRELDFKKSDAKRKAIIDKAIKCSSSNRDTESQEMVQKMVSALFMIIEKFYISHVSTGDIIAFKNIISQGTEAVIENSDKNTERIIKAIGKTEQELDFNQEIDKLEKLIIHRKEMIKNQALFPWFYDSLKYREVFPSLFVVPKFKKRSGECNFNELLSYNHRHMAILGDAGAGKSTLLKYLFAFNLMNDAYCYYLNASELKNVNNSIIKLFNQKKFDKEQLIVFIDGVDEAYSDDPQGYRILIDNIKNISCCCFWIACRSDFFYRTLNENTAFTHDGLVIQPWNETQSEFFIKKYSKIVNCTDIPKRIENMVEKSNDFVKFKQNPFQLALLVFLAENSKEENVKGLYSLYESFIKIWINREKDRNTSMDSKEDIFEEFYIAAKQIYSGDKYKISTLTKNNTAVRNLLNIDTEGLLGNQYASTFYHRSLAAYFLARNALVSMIENDTKKLTEIFSFKLKDDVTNFVNDAFEIMPIVEKQQVKCNLQSFYDEIKYRDECLSIKEQIIYYLTRLGMDVSCFLLNEINPRPINLTMRLTLAYGCVLSDVPEVKEFALEYAKSIADNSEDAITNRAWTVIYFGDKIGNPYEYKDNERCPWEKARNARIKRFTKKNPRPKDYRFRLFDIPLFYSFLCDRGWNNLTIEEYEVLNNLQFPIEHFNEKERDFLGQQLSCLLKEYKKKLNATC